MKSSQILLTFGSIFVLFLQTTQGTAFFGAFFIPDAPITLFQSTLLVPAASTAPRIPGDVQAIWPGLQNKNAPVSVLQNVVTNLGTTGEWYHKPFYCCDPAKNLQGNQKVWPGDRLTSIFGLDDEKLRWSDIWYSSPGEEARISLAPIRQYTFALLVLELQKGAKWDFGPIGWRDIIIQANTTRTEWCLRPNSSGSNVRMLYSPPVVTSNAGSTLCRIAELTIERA
ncbi:hypothetical protein B0O99DRAFT_589008 [Bisporella sp. PMI_857]|nr:hypothetical protein B0O99DRAFT_589008 [Bisporella sp. PMI_857]